jgi:hypothetical protein
LKELSVEAALDRAQSPGPVCQCGAALDEKNAASTTATTTKEQYLEATERRFTGVTRCC